MGCPETGASPFFEAKTHEGVRVCLRAALSLRRTANNLNLKFRHILAAPCESKARGARHTWRIYAHHHGSRSDSYGRHGVGQTARTEASAATGSPILPKSDEPVHVRFAN